jgi:hypothetical protein
MVDIPGLLYPKSTLWTRWTSTPMAGRGPPEVNTVDTYSHACERAPGRGNELPKALHPSVYPLTNQRIEAIFGVLLYNTVSTRFRKGST